MRTLGLTVKMAFLLCLAWSRLTSSLQAAPVRVVVWDEQQPAQKQVYPNFIGNHIADYLRGKRGFSVVSRRLDDPGQGVDAATLDNCDVLIWWGHQRHPEIKQETGRDIAQRIKAGKLSLIALHSAHWSVPFMEAMNERAREDALKALRPEDRANVVWHETNQYPALRVLPKISDRLTPAAFYNKPFEGPVEISLVMPLCCFPAVRGDGKPSHIYSLAPQHPIMKGVPSDFVLPQTEMYGAPFHVPAPDVQVLEERWQPGEWFPSGSVWSVGKGRVFYFRPGHETFPVYKDANVLRIIENAARWMGREK
ncbi:MAG TPA: ThuA domain-containing protein [Verrucomicrobiae bacterium]|nr:ThuA domain-containing protein [Verrucomicrobiae bacterium]